MMKNDKKKNANTFLMFPVNKFGMLRLVIADWALIFCVIYFQANFFFHL